MNEKVSNYEIILPLDDAHSLLVNGLYGAFDVVDRSEGEALLAGDLKALDLEERERLLTRGHLTDSLETEQEDLTVFAGAYRKVLAERNMSLLILCLRGRVCREGLQRDGRSGKPLLRRD